MNAHTFGPVDYFEASGPHLVTVIHVFEAISVAFIKALQFVEDGFSGKKARGPQSSLPSRKCGHHNQAIKFLTSFAKRYPTDVEALLSLANLYRAAGNEPSSVENYKSVLVLDPTNEIALHAICKQ